ncbi:hypothetical protein LGM45_02405 [Burkholderia cepacia]|uniref:hypothetical protein n=1 Tax=Burkholderia cepacia TaxID=292 RepID=UPI001CF1AE6E|nr:hypothetical protein [Burkholderia cepacia]MCA7927871.1 hypothetical protein [Burkholderia cepacia]
MSAEGQIEQKVLNYVLATPAALAVLVASFLSGHLWLFIIKNVRKPKTAGNQIFESKTGRVAIGLLWLTGVLLFVYIIRFKELMFDYQRILDVCIPTIIFGVFFQLLILVAYLKFGDK